jgi:hypothetical protein
MARRTNYSYDKRQRELKRQKKREEKAEKRRLKREEKAGGAPVEGEEGTDKDLESADVAQSDDDRDEDSEDE